MAQCRRLFWIFCLLLPALTLGRGGGGQHYSGGHSSSFSSGSHSFGGGGRYSSGYHVVGGGGGGGSCDGAGLCCLLFIVLAVYIAYRILKQRDLEQTRGSFEQAQARQRAIPAPPDLDGLSEALREKDPTFQLPLFLEKAEAIFRKLQQGWFERNLEPVRPFLSDATFERFSVQLQMLAAQGVRNALSDLQVRSIQLVGLEQNAWYDTTHVRIRASLRDVDVPSSLTDEEALREASQADAAPFTEIWSFVRKPGAKSRPGQDALSGKCPNCGAPFTGGAANNCAYCGAIVNSGTYDWVLAEITQGSEAGAATGSVPGLETLRAGDPALSVEVLEDRASLIFFKWIDAQSRNEPRSLAKLATPEAVRELEADAATMKARGDHRVFLECAVGAVVTRAFSVEGDRQLAHVEVRWSARGGVVHQGQRVPTFPTVPQRSILTLVRKSGVLTPTTSGMSTNRCPQCNAPLTTSAAPACDFCGTVLSDGGRDWVFAQLIPIEQWNTPTSERPAAGVPEVLDRDERQRLLYMMAAMAAADGRVDASERRLLEKMARRWDVPWANVEMALSAGSQLFENLIPQGTAHAEAFLRALLDMALVDGKIDRTERRMLDQVATRLGLTERLRTWLGSA